jgi:hypothetical protein
MGVCGGSLGFAGARANVETEVDSRRPCSLGATRDHVVLARPRKAAYASRCSNRGRRRLSQIFVVA